MLWLADLLESQPPTGEPSARNWPARFGGRRDLIRRPYPYHLFRFFLDQASLRAGKVTVFCVRQRFARSSLRLSTCKSFWDFVREASGGICTLLGSDGPIFSLAQLCNFGGGIAKDRNDASRLSVCVHECTTFNAVVTFPVDGEVSVSFFEVDGLWVPIAGQPRSKLI